MFFCAADCIPSFCVAGHGLKAQSLPGSSVQVPSHKSSTAESMVNKQTSPQCIIRPVNAANRKLPQQQQQQQQLTHSSQRLSQAQVPASYVSPRASVNSATPRARHVHADNAENDFHGQLHSPASISSNRKSTQKGRKQKRPQWQDVSIDLSAIQAAQEQAAYSMDHNDMPVGAMLPADTAAAHMSGVSPASPSPPKQHASRPPCHPLKSHSSVPTLPTLTLDAGNPPEALAAWHENVGLSQQQQNSQRLWQGSRQHSDAARKSLPHAEPLQLSQHRHSRQAQLPTCLPPLHHQPLHHPPTPHSKAPAEMQRQLSTQEMYHRILPTSHLREEAENFPTSSSRYPLQASTDFPPSASRLVEVPGEPSSSPCHVAEKDDGFQSASPSQVVSEDPRSAQQIPMQYMRHPFGSGSPGGLHRLHRLLKPLARSRHPPANSFPASGATHTSGAAHLSGERPEHSHDQAEQANVAVSEPRVDWQTQDTPVLYHQQNRASLEQQQSRLPTGQHPGLHASADQQRQDYGAAQQQQHQSDVHVQPKWEESSSGALNAADTQDVNMRLQQVCTASPQCSEGRNHVLPAWHRIDFTSSSACSSQCRVVSAVACQLHVPCVAPSLKGRPLHQWKQSTTAPGTSLNCFH